MHSFAWHPTRCYEVALISTMQMEGGAINLGCVLGFC